MSEPSPHRVLRLWVRPGKQHAMEERDALEFDTGKGVRDDHSYGKRRQVTLLCEEDWKAATADLGQDVDPSGRRANVLLSGGRAGDWIGKTLKIGETVVEILEETVPCLNMEKAAKGLMTALEPEGRGGVWGRIVEGGSIGIGDELRPLSD